jgi:glycosyltransferase involved in cell wall biosynthesis
LIELSIITINYNNALGLKKTIESIVNQKEYTFEYIVVDGGSSDESIEVIERYQSKINHWVSEKDDGIYNAMNKGILMANGRYLLFLNSGDYLVNDYVLKKVFAIKHNAAIIYGNMQIDWGNNNIKIGKMPSKITLNHMLKDTLWHPVSFIKKDLFITYGLYNENYKIVADYDFFFKTIIVHSVSTSYLNQTISYYNVQGLSSKPENKELEKEERKNVIKSYLPHLSEEIIEEKRKIRLSIFTKIKKMIGK